MMRFFSFSFKWGALGIFFTAIFLSHSAFGALPERQFELAFPGEEPIINYSHYGQFQNVGTEDYHYEVMDAQGLSHAAGEGIYPNVSILQDPDFQIFKSGRGRNIDVWKVLGNESPKESFYAWAGADEEGGVKLFYIGESLRQAGLLQEALKAYYAVVVHFPRSIAWSSEDFYWHVAPEAISRIRKICATYPELELELKGAFVSVVRSPEGKPELDKIRVWPGRFEKATIADRIQPPYRITQLRGTGKVKLAKYNYRFWRLLVDGKPFFVQGVTYSPTLVGESPHGMGVRPWMRMDHNRNSKNDGMFDSWVDINKNNRRDPNEPIVGDAKLLRKMGVNTIRLYHGVDLQGRYDPAEYDKALMRTLHKDYGIYFLMGDFLGAYTVGSQAAWNLGTDYTDPVQRGHMKAVVREMVLDHKDEPYVLAWLLGNENQHPYTRTNAAEHPEAYAKFLNEVAKMIHQLDSDHPVAVGNLYTSGLREIAKFGHEIDIYGANVYSGAYSMGSIWQQVKHYYDRPILFTEMGCDAYARAKGVDEKAQANYFKLNWEDVELNRENNGGEGNAIGGVLFEWMDEWWKTSRGDSWGDPFVHNTQADVKFPFPDRWSHEEWFGIFGQGDGSKSPFLREPRLIYKVIKEMWNK